MTLPSSLKINYNGELYPAGARILTSSVRGLRYGDGLFETMLVRNGRIRLAPYHFERLSAGLRLLGFASSPALDPEQLTAQVIGLCETNGHPALARVRLAVFRGEGGLFDPADGPPQYVLESSPLAGETLRLNQKGLAIDVFPDGRKPCDPFANIKSANFLLYAMAARHARDLRLDDCLVLNTAERFADTCIANLFYTRTGTVFTPPLSEGCVAGVMRRFLLDRLPGWGFAVSERPVNREDLYGADGIFLTNAVRGIRWVGHFAGKKYAAHAASELQPLLTSA